MNNKLFYKKDGTGIPLILIHGFTGSHINLPERTWVLVDLVDP